MSTYQALRRVRSALRRVRLRSSSSKQTARVALVSDVGSRLVHRAQWHPRRERVGDRRRIE